MGKLERKIGQAQRKETRQFLAEKNQIFNDKIVEKLKIFNQCLRERPKFIPKSVWRFGVSIFFDVKKLQDFMSNQ